jgi:hypothetical protein
VRTVSPTAGLLVTVEFDRPGRSELFENRWLDYVAVVCRLGEEVLAILSGSNAS